MPDVLFIAKAIAALILIALLFVGLIAFDRILTRLDRWSRIMREARGILPPPSTDCERSRPPPQVAQYERRRIVH